MDRVFFVKLHNTRAPDCTAYLNLPTTGYRMQDALDKLRLQKGDIAYCSVEDFGGFDFLSDILAEKPNPHELNALAQQLVMLDEEGRAAFEGLMLMEQNMEPGPRSPIQLINLTYNVEHCNVYPGVVSYEELGHFYVDNDMVPELAGITPEGLNFLNYEQIGQNLSRKEGGVLTSKGYYIQTTGLKSVTVGGIAPLAIPNYTVLLRLTYSQEQTVLELPADPSLIDAALEHLGAEHWSQVECKCLDCAAPALTSSIEQGTHVDWINLLAQHLQEMDAGKLLRFKAVVAAKEDYTVWGAIHIAETLEDYSFSPEFISPEDVARDFLSSTLTQKDLKTLLPHIDWKKYGKSFLEAQESSMTDYGLISREDGQCMSTSQKPPDPQERGEMTQQ